MTAVITEHRAGEVCHGLRIKLEKIPVARLAHGGFATKFVQFEDKTGFFLFRHKTLLFGVYGTCAACAGRVLHHYRPDLSVVRAPSTIGRTARARIDNTGDFFIIEATTAGMQKIRPISEWSLSESAAGPSCARHRPSERLFCIRALKSSIWRFARPWRPVFTDARLRIGRFAFQAQDIMQ